MSCSAPTWFWIFCGWLAGDSLIDAVAPELRADRDLARLDAAFLPMPGAPRCDPSRAERAAAARLDLGAAGVDTAGPPATARLDPAGLDTLGIRELRALPGVGATRARTIARARWELRGTGSAGSAPLYLSALPGIGRVTEERVREALAAGDETRQDGPLGCP